MKKAVILLAVAATVIPTSSWAQPADRGGQPDWLEQAKAIAEIEGISVGEAVRRGQLEQKLASQMSRLENDASYAGSEIVRSKNSYKIVHYFTDRRTTSSDADLDSVSEFRQVRYSMREMKAFQKEATALIFKADSNAYTAIVPSLNRLTLTTSKTDAVVAALASIGGVPPFVELKSGGWFSSDDAAMMGGGAISGSSGSCTAGFNVRGSVTGVSTASHCVPYNLQTYQGVSIGTHRGPAYQSGVTTLAGRDFTWYRNDANTYNSAVKYQSSFFSITSVAPAAPAVNTPVCLIKQNDTQGCAYVAEIATPPGGTYNAVIMDRHVAVNGDSGGPWLYASAAYGIHQGRKCDDAAMTINCRSLYSPAAHMPAVLGVSVIY